MLAATLPIAEVSKIKVASSRDDADDKNRSDTESRQIRSMISMWLKATVIQNEGSES